METTKENELIPIALQIILHAGDARIKADDALEMAKRQEFSAAYEGLSEARLDIIHAHQAQTSIIQYVAQGIVYEPCLLFTHAQDTLMTIASEVRFAKQLVSFYELIVQESLSKKNN